MTTITIQGLNACDRELLLLCCSEKIHAALAATAHWPGLGHWSHPLSTGDSAGYARAR